MSLRVGPDDVGERVVLRVRREDPPPGEPALTDVIGVLRTWRDGTATVEHRDAGLVAVALADVVAGKVLGPPAQRRDRPAPY